VSGGWWRRNRSWLPALPFALAALLGASSYNLHDYWYLQGLHHVEASGEQGEFVRITDEYVDAQGATSRTLRVRLSGIDETATYPYDQFEDGPRAVGPGQQALVVHLDWQADPDQTIKLCQVALVDDEGRRYEQAGDGQPDPCTPDGHGGPEPANVKGSVRGAVPDGEERPPTWSTAPVFLLPAGVRVTRVLVWWDFPDYVSLSVS
jgi:hypothetical protein